MTSRIGPTQGGANAEGGRLRWKERTSEEMARDLREHGIPARLVRRLQARTTRLARRSLPAGLPEASAAQLEEIARRTEVPNLVRLDRVEAPEDGFAKYLFRGDGLEPFEAVRIPLLHRPERPRYVVCVSSQVGCGLGCAFCATARIGFRRNLRAWEMVDQVVKVREESPHPVTGVVFMGMGEPLLNYDAVMRAASILSEPCGGAIAAKAISISTVGIVPGIRRYTRERRPYRLVISLASADPRTRERLVPIAARYPLDELAAAAREHHDATGVRLTIAWTMISGVNTGIRDAREIARLFAGIPIQLDLIDVNDATGEFEPPPRDERERFRDALRAELGMPVVRRYSGGRSIDAACGMLTGSSILQRYRAR
jgi:23S rRNA (adenine2503-C2)-methyltransferase